MCIYIYIRKPESFGELGDAMIFEIIRNYSNAIRNKIKATAVIAHGAGGKGKTEQCIGGAAGR